MLWLALWLPDLPLAAHPARPLPSVIAERGQIVVADEVAAAAGINAGMRTATARGLLPEIAVVARDPAREAALLEELACWAGAFTPDIVLSPPAALLLEIGGCLKLFGGPARLVAAVAAGCVARGLSPHLAAAPTPLAALWMARAAGPAQGADDGADQGADGAWAPQTLIVATREALPEALAALPVAVLEPSPEIATRLASFGVRRLADLFALPRAGLTRRLGNDFSERLERALGERPDPRPRFVFPEKFSLRLELPGRVGDAMALAFAARRLIEAMCGWLLQRQSGAARCTLICEHERSTRHAATSALELACASPTREPERWLRLVRERLERTRLVAPVEAIRLVAEATETLPGRSGDLFDSGRESEKAALQLVERLRARLGEAAVHGLAPVADHRPECATRVAPLGTPLAAAKRTNAAPRRPLWLLEQPETLPEVGGRPHRRGAPLELLAGPERIEAGWWDGGERRADARPGSAGAVAATGDIRRDYFIARTPQRECLWIFRDGGGWHLHGLFA